MELIFTGFEIGLFIAIIAYVTTIFTKKDIPWLRSGFMFLAIPLLLLYHFPLRFYEYNGTKYPTMDFLSIMKVIGSSLLLAILVGSIAQLLSSIYSHLRQQSQLISLHSKAFKIICVVSVLIPIAIIFAGSKQTISFYYHAILRGLALFFGLWVALKLFWTEKN